jgi:ubiquinone/menaquinone biosynthesis C-methylase UbiE
MDEDQSDGYARRAATYDTDVRSRFHERIAARTVDLVVEEVESMLGSGARPARVLDVGCGTGLLLHRLQERVPSIDAVGIDPAPEMIRRATLRASNGRPTFAVGVAESIPEPDAAFDVVVSSTSFSHWRDQGAGLAECFRVLRSEGSLVLVDVFTSRRLPRRIFGPGGRSRSQQRATRALRDAGFATPRWQPLFAQVIKAAVASKH